MKTTELKKLIKGAVKEAIQEELKEILLEAVRAPRIGGTAAPSPVMESTMMGTPTTNVAQPTNPPLTEQEKREAYKNILGDMAAPLNSSKAQGTFQPQGGYDVANGSLPGGNVGMDQIMGLMKK
jgi:hypothetical protein